MDLVAVRCKKFEVFSSNIFNMVAGHKSRPYGQKTYVLIFSLRSDGFHMLYCSGVLSQVGIQEIVYCQQRHYSCQHDKTNLLPMTF